MDEGKFDVEVITWRLWFTPPLASWDVGRALSSEAEGADRPAHGNGRADVAPSPCSAPSCHALAWGAEERDQVRSRETVLIHKVAEQIGDARLPARPFLFLVCGVQRPSGV